MGNEVLSLLQAKDRHNNLIDPEGRPTNAGLQIINETTSILELCGDPETEVFRETGLVIGYVQSGKTLSFTTLTAMARDNDYKLIIIIAGTSKPLSQQTTDRLQQDLRLPRSDRRWMLIANPKGTDQRNSIKAVLDQWTDPYFPRNECQTIIITVMKNGSHLRNLDALLQTFNLNGVSTLIIDDEGDQASLNTNAKRAADEGRPLTDVEASTIYRRITDIRSRLPHHTFLQYTATPQAPLFINILDRLSPNFIKLLTPGESYTGGRTFFIERPELVRPIPTHDLDSDDNHLTAIPQSLLEALRIFYLGVAAGFYNGEASGSNRTMMIHPSRTTGEHRDYQNWVNNTVNSWIRLLDEPEGNQDKEEFLLVMERSHAELSLTVPGLPSFAELQSSHVLNRALRYTQRIVVNARAGRTPEIPWTTNYSFILIGGQALDRGFTVEGLTVTYMPRDIGTGNVDTVLQRARFFGYKGNYLGYCRLFLPNSVIHAYRDIIRHEEDVRNRLAEYNINNLHLDNWNRQAVLNSMLSLTRRNVLYDEVVRSIIRGNQWTDIKSPQDTEELIGENLEVLMTFVTEHQSLFMLDPGDPRRTEEQKNLLAKIAVRDILDNLLNKLKFTRATDSNNFTLIRSVLTDRADALPELTCNLYLMSVTDIQHWSPSIRGIDGRGQISQLFQGSNVNTGYPGARNIMVPGEINVQVHLLNIRDMLGVAYRRVPTLALSLPSSLESHTVLQPTNSNEFIRPI
ncbi:hypothetical protein GCM10028805_27180 [Spirosoma harenae]